MRNHTAAVLSLIAVLPLAAQSYRAPRTPDGHPDLQGVWSYATLTPLERPTELAGKQVLTEQEAAEYQKRVLEEADAPNPQAGGIPLGLQAGGDAGKRNT